MNVAVAELLYCIFTAVIYPFKFFKGLYELGPLYCLLSVALRYSLSSAAWYTLATVSLSRYLTIR